MKPNYVKDNIAELIKEPSILYEEMVQEFYNKHLNNVSDEVIATAHEIRSILLKQGKTTGSQLASQLNTGTPYIRKAIQHIRMYYSWGDSYLVADVKGYFFTNDPELIKGFLHKTLTRFKNTHAQINTMLLTLTKDKK